MSLHKDHRQRLKTLFRKEGLDSFAPHNVLELLLFYAIPQKDVNPLAHELIDHFGSLQAVFDAPYERLVRFSGLGEHSATLIKMMPDLCRYYLQQGVVEEAVVDSESAWQYLAPKFVGRTIETVLLLCMDSKGKVLKCTEISTGSVNSSEINNRKILTEAIACNASGLILAHNHPGGVALASSEDLTTTRKLQKLLEEVGIQLVDHLVVGDGDYVSLAATHGVR